MQKSINHVLRKHALAQNIINNLLKRNNIPLHHASKIIGARIIAGKTSLRAGCEELGCTGDVSLVKGVVFKDFKCRACKSKTGYILERFCKHPVVWKHRDLIVAVKDQNGTARWYVKCNRKGCEKKILWNNAKRKPETLYCAQCCNQGNPRNKPYESLYNAWKVNQRSRQIDILLSLKQFSALQKDSRCFYCGAKNAATPYYCRRERPTITKRIGGFLDRLNNSAGYSWANVVPSCGDCNKTRGAKMTVREMLILSASRAQNAFLITIFAYMSEAQALCLAKEFRNKKFDVSNLPWHYSGANAVRAP